MRRVFVVAALLLLSVQASATTIQPMQAIDLVDQAELIFTGTAVDRQVATSRDGRYPYTFITFEVGSVLKGSTSGDTLTLRFEGGELGDEYIEVHGMPAFERGGEYLLFVADNGRAISPVVGWEQGKLELIEHPSIPGAKLLLDRRGMAIEGLGGDTFLRARVEREGRSVVRAKALPSGIEVRAEDGVTITDPAASDLAKAGLELVPASIVLRSLRALAERRARATGYRAGAVVRSLTVDDVPDTFSLRPSAAADR